MSDGSSSTGRCTCGKTKNGQKYCEAGNGAEVFHNYFNLQKEMIENYSEYCHTTERNVKCAFYERFPTDDYISFRNRLDEAEYKAYRSHELQGVLDYCVLDVVFQGKVHLINSTSSLNFLSDKFREY